MDPERQFLHLRQGLLLLLLGNPDHLVDTVGIELLQHELIKLDLFGLPGQ